MAVRLACLAAGRRDGLIGGDHQSWITSSELFSEYGVNGTSLQMIADAVGVTKAAVYHQFPAKRSIALAVADVELGRIARAIDTAYPGGGVEEREALLADVIDMAVTRRQAVRTLQSDPVMVRVLAEHEPFAVLMDRLFTALLGDATGSWPRTQAAVLSAAIGGAVAHPFVADVDDETLKTELRRVVARLLALPD